MTTRYAIWCEGYLATGESAKASKLGEVEAESFQEACDKLCGPMFPGELYDREKLSVWGCKLFDNETDARKSFG